MMLSSPANKNDHYKGDLKAEVVVIEYGDYECPLSSRTLEWPQVLLSVFQKKVCFVYRHYPLRNIHANALRAAVAAEIASGHGLFWEMHALLFANHNDLSYKKLITLSHELGIEEKDFLTKFKSREVLYHVRQDLISAERSGVTSTPSFFLNNQRLEGPVSLEILQKNIHKILGGYRISA
jgi:protein-disulfide isomerase